MGARGPKPQFTNVSCPNENCPLFGLVGRGNIVSRGTRPTKSGDTVRIFRCNRCGKNFNSRTGTAYEHLHCSQDEFDSASLHIMKGCGIRDTAELTDHSPTTIVAWNRRAGKQSRGVSAALEDDLRPANLQFDELTAMIKERYVPEENENTFRIHAPWIWTAIEPNNRYWMGATVGDRTRATGKRFLNEVWDKMVEGHIPTMTSDGYHVYREAIQERFFILQEYKSIMTHRRHFEEVPPKGLRYGQVIKERNGRKLDVVEYREVFGHVPPQDFNTSYVERLNLTIRTFMSRMVRLTIRFSKKAEMLQNAVDTYRAYYNLCRPHSSLPLAENPCKRSEHCTPAVCQGITDHRWSMREMMGYLFRQNMHYKL